MTDEQYKYLLEEIREIKSDVKDVKRKVNSHDELTGIKLEGFETRLFDWLKFMGHFHNWDLAMLLAFGCIALFIILAALKK